MAAATDVERKAAPAAVIVGGSCTLDPGSIAGGANEDQTIAVEEAKVGDLVIVAPRAALTDGLIVTGAHVSAAGTITFTLENQTGSPIDEGSATWDWTLIRGNLAFAGTG